MPVRPLVMFPDPRLRLRAEPVVSFDPELASAAQDLADTLRSVGAIGLAGPHVGIRARIIVVRLDIAGETRILVDPEIVWASAEMAAHDEGSVSMPGLRERVTRPERIRMRFQTLEGDLGEDEATGFAAAVLQHEIDQLDGIFWIERLSRLRRDRVLKRFGRTR